MIKFLQRLGQCLAACWHLVKEALQIVHGIWHITGLPTSCITIFGGSRLPQDSPFSSQANDLARTLVEHNFSILTGGGPGIMESANCGAAEAGGAHRIVTLGFSIYGLIDEKLTNRCVSDKSKHIVLNYFFARKWLLTQYSVGFCVFPGGLGTMDELFDLLNLMITHKLPYAPVVLIGTEYWKAYQTWIVKAHEHGLIAQEREPHVVITDNINEAVSHIVAHHQKNTPPREK
jgi:uncharacterized protein (TIGR00730 family)